MSSRKRRLLKQFEDYTNSLIDEEILHGEHFDKVKDMSIPNEEFLTKIQNIEKALDELNEALEQKTDVYKYLYGRVFILGFKSARIGAIRVERVCNNFMKHADECQKYILEVTAEYSLVKDKLDTLFQLRQQVLDAMN